MEGENFGAVEPGHGEVTEGEEGIVLGSRVLVGNAMEDDLRYLSSTGADWEGIGLESLPGSRADEVCLAWGRQSGASTPES